MKIYLASGWFTPAQEEARQDMLEVLESTQHEVFSPKEDNLWQPGDNPEHIFKANLREIENADIVVASTIDKDMGTIFECGYAYAKGIPVVYYAPGLEGDFNLMLALSSRDVAKTRPALHAIAQYNFPKRDYLGGIE